MSTRRIPEHVKAVCEEYDSRISMEWDDDVIGWFLTYEGVRQPSCLQHIDGSWIMDPSADETRRLLQEMDLHNKDRSKGSFMTRYTRMKRNRDYRRKLTEQRSKEKLTEEVSNIADWSRRQRGKVGDLAKPFVEIKNNPITNKED